MDNVLIIRNEKGGVQLRLFPPNLTMNLTYLCYGSSKVMVDLET